MKKTALKFGLYAILIFAIHYFAAIRADGYFDPFYLRFTNGKHASMIIGTSRAAQGLQPAVFNEKLKNNYAPMGNFGFTALNSPYGEVYFRGIKKKLKKRKSNKKKLFILSVDPWSLSNKENPDDEVSKYRENGLFLDRMVMVGQKGKPNFDYLAKNYTKSWANFYKPVDTTEMLLHEDGWLEVTVPMQPNHVRSRTNSKVRTYRTKVLPNYTFSPNRFKQLEATAQYLRKYGEVVFVRLPIAKEMKALEDIYIKDFDTRMCTLAKKMTLRYWSFVQDPDNYVYTDGNHIYKDSGKKLSADIANMVLQKQPTMCR